ncbi:hypothetical protein OAS39_10210 [Pirellulales bacterium]|nr:hypothetical protein [Pirellulales bacterium]
MNAVTQFTMAILLSVLITAPFYRNRNEKNLVPPDCCICIDCSARRSLLGSANARIRQQDLVTSPEPNVLVAGAGQNDIYGVKWRNWKINMLELDNVMSVTRKPGMPRVYNLLSDPQENVNVLFPNTWVTKAGLVQLTEHAMSLKENSPIAPGAPDPYEPPK